jgi:hypothetical protein
MVLYIASNGDDSKSLGEVQTDVAVNGGRSFGAAVAAPAALAP